MSKKDYVLIAAVIKQYGEDEIPHGPQIARAFADALASTNPRFNRETFLKACGVK